MQSDPIRDNPETGLSSISEFQKFCSENQFKNEDILICQQLAPNRFRLTPGWREFRFIDLFAGIGGMRLAGESVGGRCVFSSEWDPEARTTYQAHFGEVPAGDITQVLSEDIPAHDLLLAGFPCQPFSIIGQRQGFADTRGTLFHEIVRILHHHRPAAVLLENVKQFRTHDQGRTCQTVVSVLQEAGYSVHVNVLNALHYGVAQKRERTFIVGFREACPFSWPKPFGYRPELSAVLEPEESIPPALIASPSIREKRLARLRLQGDQPYFPTMWHENKGGHIGLLPYSYALRHNASYNYLLVNGYRRPTGRELLRLQGFPETFKIVVNHSAIRAQAGNAVAVPVVSAILTQMMLAMRAIGQGTAKKQLSLFP
jgi:DNA (cytosine-5)-methyltransferase 1